MARVGYFTDQILEENANQNILIQKKPRKNPIYERASNRRILLTVPQDRKHSRAD